jgi:hypothetical protein
VKSQEKTLQSFGIGLYGDREGKDAGESVAQGADQASVTRAIHGVATTTAGFMTVDFFLKQTISSSEQGYSAVLRNVKIGNAIV